METLSYQELEENILTLKGQLEEKQAEYMNTLETFLNADGLVKRQVEIALNKHNREFFEIKDRLAGFENMLATVKSYEEGVYDEAEL